MRFYALANRPWVEDEGGGYWGLPPGTIGSIGLGPAGAQGPVFVTSDQAFDSRAVLVAFGTGTKLDQLVLTGRQRNDWTSLTGVAVASGATLLDALWATLTVQADPTGLVRARPIMPTHRGVLELHLGGHSMVRAERLPEDPTLHPAWTNIQQVLRAGYRGIQARDETLARKWLGAQRVKLRLSAERVSELLIDADLPRVPPIEPTTTVSDDFNRADGGIGANWTNVQGVWLVSSNTAKLETSTSAGGATYNTDLSSDDHYAESDRVGGSGLDVLARATNAKDPHYRGKHLFQSGAGQTLQIFLYSDGWSSTQLYFDTTGATPGRLGIECDGSTITVYSDNRPRQSITDTTVTGNLRAGIGTNFSSAVTHDNFEAADLVAGGEGLVRVLAESMAAVEQRSRLMAITRRRSDSLGVGHASLRPRSLSRLLAETNGIGEATVAVVEAIGAELLRVISEAVAATEAVARVLGLTRRRHEALGIGGAAVRLRALARRRGEPAAVAETVNSARAIVRLRSEAATISEITVTVVDAIIAAVVRVVSEVIGTAELLGRPRHRARSRGETVVLAATVVQVGGVLGAAPAAIAERARMVVGAATRLVVRAASRFTVPPARR